MGRVFDGGYAECTLVPASQVIPIDTDLDWETVGSLPEMLQTAYGSPTLPDTLRATRVHGVVRFTGMLSNRWIGKEFNPTGCTPGTSFDRPTGTWKTTRE